MLLQLPGFFLVTGPSYVQNLQAAALAQLSTWGGAMPTRLVLATLGALLLIIAGMTLAAASPSTATADPRSHPLLVSP